MSEDFHDMNIFQRLTWIRKQVKYIKKDQRVQNQYMAVTHDQVTAQTREFFVEAGVLVLPTTETRIIKDDVMRTSKGVPILRYEALYTIRFICDNKPDDNFSITIDAHANDTGDKAPGKALSYAVKYAILKVLNLETGESDESRVQPVEEKPRITDEQTVVIKSLLEETNADETKFLKWLKVGSIEDIPAQAYEYAVKALEVKRGKK